MIVQCKCKCGTEFEEFDKWGRKREFVRGHQNRGKIHSVAIRLARSIATSGENNPNYGKIFSNEYKQKIKEAWVRMKQEPNYDPKIYGSPGKKNPNWRGGLSFEPYCFEFTIWLKEEIKERDNYQCQNPNCDKEITKNNPLCVHHINYRKKDCSSNNLITLCNSCNAKANYNREYWKEFYNNVNRITII